MVQETADRPAARPAGPVRTAVGVISGKWKPSILRSIHAGRERFVKIHEDAPGVSDQTLTRHLRELSADGVIKRDPGRTVYSPTWQGLWLAGIMEALEGWGAPMCQTAAG